MIYSFTKRFGVVTVSVALAVTMLAAPSAVAIGFDRDDFIVTGFLSNNIAVYNHDLTFKGFLDDEVRRPTGLDFDATGNLVIARQQQSFVTSQILVYDESGSEVGGFANAALGDPLDVKVGPNGNYYVGTQDLDDGDGLREFRPDGTIVRQFGAGDYEGVAVLPGVEIWGGIADGGSSLEVFSRDTGASIGTVAFDHEQQIANSMYYSRLTNSVLLSDLSAGAVYERDLVGTFIQEFNAPGLGTPFGVTRGPLGDVYAIDFDDGGVYRWTTDGIFVGFTSLQANVSGPVGIVWAGNSVPEPSSLLAFGSGGLIWILSYRKKRPITEGDLKTEPV